MQSGGVCREARSEVSGTAKGGTDGQEVQKEAQSGGSRWHNTPKAGTALPDVCRCTRDHPKAMGLTRGDLPGKQETEVRASAEEKVARQKSAEAILGSQTNRPTNPVLVVGGG